MPVWLVTGATGFLGRHVLHGLEPFEHGGREVIALGRRRPASPCTAGFAAADLDDPVQVERAILEHAPNVVIHTAGRTPPAAPAELYRANTLATLHLLEALRALGRPARVVLAGSAAELGPVDDEHLPAREDHPCHPAGAYGLSKWLATAAGLTMQPPLEVIVARVFNPIGPGTPPTQAFGRFATRLAEPGPDPLELPVGDLTTRRDFIDVRDAARALITLATEGRPGLVYHVGTGQSRAVHEGLDELIRLSGRDVRLGPEPRLAATPGPRDSRAAIIRITSHTSWRPQIPWEQSLADLWHDVRLPLTVPPALV